MPRVEYGPSYPPEKGAPLGKEFEEDVNVPGSPYFGHLPRASDLPSETWRGVLDTSNPVVRVPGWYFNPPSVESQSLGRILRGLLGRPEGIRGMGEEPPQKKQEEKR